MHMQVLRLLAARRAVPVSIASASASAADACCHESQEQHYDDEGPFFDLDFRASSVRASSASSGRSSSGSDSDESCAELDFVISLQRSRSSSALPFEPKLNHHQRVKLVGLRTLSFGAARSKAAHFPRRRSSCSSSSSRCSSSARSSALTLRLFMDTPDRTEEEDDAATERGSSTSSRKPSGDAIRRCLTSISSRLTRFRAADGARRLRKCHSAPASRSDDSALETQDGIAGAIAHCKESFHRGI